MLAGRLCRLDKDLAYMRRDMEDLEATYQRSSAALKVLAASLTLMFGFMIQCARCIMHSLLSIASSSSPRAQA